VNSAKLSNPQPVALVTGSAKRVGAVIARTLHQAGFRVVIHYRHSEQDARALHDELNHIRTDSACLMQADLNDMDGINARVQDALSTWQQLDLLVNCASDYFPTQLGSTTIEQWNTLHNSNVAGPYFMAQACLPWLQSSAGQIINIIDINAQKPTKHFAVYCAAKAGLAMLTKALALDLAPTIRVNGVAPGITIWAEGTHEVPENQRHNVIDQIPLQQLVDPTDIAKTVLFLQQNASITGEVIHIDAGRLLA